MAKQSDLTDEESSAFRRLLTDAIEYDRYPLSPASRPCGGTVRITE